MPKAMAYEKAESNHQNPQRVQVNPTPPKPQSWLMFYKNVSVAN